MAQNQENLDILDTEFQINLQLASNYMKQMMLSEDRRVCHKYIRNCLNMRNTDQVKVKMHRNRFFNFLLKTMKRTVENQKHSVYLNVVWNKKNVSNMFLKFLPF